jgi:hypothetical protein
MFLVTPLLALVLLAPGAATRPLGMRAERSDLRARCDADLEALRAGKIEPPAPVRQDERAALRAAEARSHGLEDMRAGGVVGVLTVVLLVVLILLLI